MKILSHMLDTEKFLSPYGIRSLSKVSALAHACMLKDQCIPVNFTMLSMITDSKGDCNLTIQVQWYAVKFSIICSTCIGFISRNTPLVSINMAVIFNPLKNKFHW